MQKEREGPFYNGEMRRKPAKEEEKDYQDQSDAG